MNYLRRLKGVTRNKIRKTQIRDDLEIQSVMEYIEQTIELMGTFTTNGE